MPARSTLKIVLVGSFTPASQPGGVTTHCTRLGERLGGTPECAVRRINIKLRGTLARSLSRSNPVTWLLSALRARLRGYRLFHFNTSARNLPFPILAPALRLLGCRLILSYHSGALSANLGKCGLLADTVFRLSLALAHRVVFMNQRERDAVAARHPNHAGKFSVVHSFIAPATRRPPASNVGQAFLPVPPQPATPPQPASPQPSETAKYRAKRDVSHGCPTLPSAPLPPPASLYIVAAMGAWLPYYLFEEIIAVMRHIAAAYPAQHFQLRIAAALFNLDPDYKHRIQKLAADINSPAAPQPNLRVTTEENVEDPLAYLAASHLLVRSSSVDSFGLCVAEAISLGIPAIATDVCHRVAGTLLYAPHDTAALEAHIRRAYEHHRDGTQPPLALDPSEDAFPHLLQLYREESAA